MLEQAWIIAVLQWSQQNLHSIIWTLLMLVFYFVTTKYTLPKIEAKVSQSNLKSDEFTKAHHIAKLLIGILSLVLVLLVWGIDFSGLLVVSTSILTLTGVALFASWSLLSNITCYFLLLFHTSFRRGNFIRVLDADNYVEGYITEIGVFNTRLLTEDREIIVYPNNLIMNRPSVINPRKKWKTIGKLSDRTETKAIRFRTQGFK